MSNNQQDSCNCTPEVPSEKLHVLALHGYRQNAEVFRQKTGSFRKLLHKWVKFTYITAPHKVVLVDNLENINMDESHDEGRYIQTKIKNYSIPTYIFQNNTVGSLTETI